MPFGGNVTYDQRHARWKNDSGGADSTDWIAAEDVDIDDGDKAFDTNVRLRVVMSETSASGTSGVLGSTVQLQYSLDSGAWTTVNGSSSNVRSSASSNVADGAALTRQLTQYSSNTFRDGKFDEVDGASGSIDPVADEDWEFEFCFQFRSADLSGLSNGSHTLDLRILYAGSALSAYTKIPRYTFTIGGGTQTLVGTKFTDSDSFPAGTVNRGTVTLVGTKFTDSDSFPAGTVVRGTVTLVGTKFTDSDSFGSGSVGVGGVTLVGTKFTDADSFGAGTVVRGPVTLVGTKYNDPDSFGSGVVTGHQTLVGTKYNDPDSFGSGAVTQPSVSTRRRYAASTM